MQQQIKIIVIALFSVGYSQALAADGDAYLKPAEMSEQHANRVFAHREKWFSTCMMQAIEARPTSDENRNLYLAACMAVHGWVPMYDKDNARNRGSEMSWYDDHPGKIED